MPAGILKGSSQDEADKTPVPCDYFAGVYEYIKQMLMEEDDLQHRPCMFQDCSALQAAEKYFHDALAHNDEDSTRLQTVVRDENLDLNRSASGFAQWSGLDSQISGEGLRFDGTPSTFSYDFDGAVGSTENPSQFQNSAATCGAGPENKKGSSSLQISETMNHGKDVIFDKFGAIQMESAAWPSCKDGADPNRVQERDAVAREEMGAKESSPGEDSGRKKSNDRRDDGVEERSSKQLASYAEESGELEKYDKSMLCRNMNPGFYSKPPAIDENSDSSEDEIKKQYRKSTEPKRGRPKGSTKNRTVREVVDLMSLLTSCAQAVSGFDIYKGEGLLKKIRQHSSPYGDANERLAHYVANALEARMAATGSALYAALATRRIPASEIIESYQTYVTACPFKRMSNIYANKSIGKYTREAARIHIVDFGILYGFQWPCIIQGLSLRPGGPPMLKITGIDFPQPGFKPAERVEQTGRCLINYSKRFNVPFEYNAIAKKWEDIRIDDLKIERDEMLVVNCLYRLRHVPDESAGVDSPRDSVLSLIRKLNPDLFVHGVVNGSYNASFFATRFREALYHYSSFFDMLEATIPREDQHRSLYEREVYGRDVMNIVACEGSERVERPETCKQWQVRNQRAGFRQLKLNRELLKEVKTKVRKGYHSNFLVDEDCGWMLQGWKGRVMYALSCWKPLQE